MSNLATWRRVTNAKIEREKLATNHCIDGWLEDLNGACYVCGTTVRSSVCTQVVRASYPEGIGELFFLIPHSGGSDALFAYCCFRSQGEHRCLQKH